MKKLRKRKVLLGQNSSLISSLPEASKKLGVLRGGSERERERESVCVCVSKRKSERERETERERALSSQRSQERVEQILSKVFFFSTVSRFFAAAPWPRRTARARLKPFDPRRRQQRRRRRRRQRRRRHARQSRSFFPRKTPSVEKKTFQPKNPKFSSGKEPD